MRKVATIQRLAKLLLECGRNKLWIIPNEMERVAAAQNYEHVRQLVVDNIIIHRRDKVNSRTHARNLREDEQREAERELEGERAPKKQDFPAVKFG